MIAKYISAGPSSSLLGPHFNMHFQKLVFTEGGAEVSGATGLEYSNKQIISN